MASAEAGPGSPESGEGYKEQLLAAWQQLTAVEQVVTALDLLADLMSSEQQLRIRTELATRWPIETEHLAEALPRIEITRNDLLTACFIQDEIDQLTDADLLTISHTMREHYVHDVFWPEVEYVAEAVLEQKRQQGMGERLAESSAAAQPFAAWMTAIDQQTWALAGCSIYDLPDADFQSMFAQELTPAEVVNRVLEVAGFDFEDE